jgi:hypothetical protein
VNTIRIISQRIVLTIVCLLASYTESTAQTYKSYYEYNYSYYVRTACRESGQNYGYYYAILCANNLIDYIKKEEIRQAQLDLMKSETDLNNEMTKRVKNRYYRRTKYGKKETR